MYIMSLRRDEAPSAHHEAPRWAPLRHERDDVRTAASRSRHARHRLPRDWPRGAIPAACVAYRHRRDRRTGVVEFRLGTFGCADVGVHSHRAGRPSVWTRPDDLRDARLAAGARADRPGVPPGRRHRRSRGGRRVDLAHGVPRASPAHERCRRVCRPAVVRELTATRRSAPQPTGGSGPHHRLRCLESDIGPKPLCLGQHHGGARVPAVTAHQVVRRFSGRSPAVGCAGSHRSPFQARLPVRRGAHPPPRRSPRHRRPPGVCATLSRCPTLPDHSSLPRCPTSSVCASAPCTS